MSTPEARLRAGLDRLVGAAVLTRDQADAVLREASVDAEPEPEHRYGWTTVLAEVGGYIGAAFVVAAVAVVHRIRTGTSCRPARGSQSSPSRRRPCWWRRS